MPEKSIISNVSTEKLYYQISEISQLTGINESTLRNWEDQYEELRNVRRINNRRHYTTSDIETIKQIKQSRLAKSIKPQPHIDTSKLEPSIPESTETSTTEIECRQAINVHQIMEDLLQVRDELRRISQQLT